MFYECPVCGYREMEYPAKDFSICPRCGTEFGVEDSGRAIEEVRERWIKRGSPWFNERAREKIK